MKQVLLAGIQQINYYNIKKAVNFKKRFYTNTLRTLFYVSFQNVILGPQYF